MGVVSGDGGQARVWCRAEVMWRPGMGKTLIRNERERSRRETKVGSMMCASILE